jgi:AcrR family transcriptional regulator
MVFARFSSRQSAVCVIATPYDEINIHTDCMKITRRTQAERTATTRAVLVAAARRLFATQGFSDVSSEKIAQAAGVTRGALYHHFADKTDVFAAVFELIEGEVVSRIAAAVSAMGPTDPIAQMRLGASTWLDACLDPEVHRITILDAPAVLGLARWRDIGDQYGMALVVSLLESAVESGRIPSQPIAPLGHVMLGTLREGATYLASAKDTTQARVEVGAIIDRLIVSLAVD